MKKRQRAYLLPEVLCPATTLDICVSVPNDLGHILPFLAQIEYLANWYAWETNVDRDNATVAACWREVFNQVRSRIDDHIGCNMTGLQDIRMTDCVIEKQDSEGNWTEVGSVADCVTAGIADALADGTIPLPEYYPVFPDPELNDVNTTMSDLACGIADGMSNYLIEKFNDSLDLIEAAIGAGVATAKIAADVVDAIAGWAPIVGGVIAAVKDVIEGSVSVTFAVIHASDTVEWRSDVKCALYQRIRDNDGKIGADRTVVIDGWIDDIKAMTPAISPLMGRWLDGIDMKAFLKLQKIFENNEGECDDCDYRWRHDFDFSIGAHGWQAFSGRGTLESDGWHAVSAGDGITNYLYVMLNIPEGANIDGFVLNITASDVYHNSNDMLRGKDGENWTGTQLFTWSAGLGDHWSNSTYDVGADIATATGTKTLLYALTGYLGSTNILHSVRLYGTGTEPAWS